MIISKCLDSVIKIYIKVTTVIIGLLIDVNFKSIRLLKNILSISGYIWA